MTADSITLHQRAEIISLDQSEIGERLNEVGFWPGKTIELLVTAPFGDPLAFKIDDTVIALRKEEARSIEVRLSSTGS